MKEYDKVAGPGAVVYVPASKNWCIEPAHSISSFVSGADSTFYHISFVWHLVEGISPVNLSTVTAPLKHLAACHQ